MTTKTNTIEFTAAAQANIDETSADVSADLNALRTGEHTAESLLAHCLDGADPDREQGWRDYVDALESASTDTHYTTRGNVRGSCGHRHRTLETAARCLNSDIIGCHRHGGYSDRTVKVVKNGREQGLCEEDSYRVAAEINR